MGAYVLARYLLVCPRGLLCPYWPCCISCAQGYRQEARVRRGARQPCPPAKEQVTCVLVAADPGALGPALKTSQLFIRLHVLQAISAMHSPRWHKAGYDEQSGVQKAVL